MSVLYPDGYILQQDNAPPHTASRTTNWLKENGIRKVKWPPGSPDFNIIENLWALMKDKLQKSEPKTTEEWAQEIQKIWDNLDPDLLKSLFDSLKNRIEKCIEAKGATVK
jgi:transposase